MLSDRQSINYQLTRGAAVAAPVHSETVRRVAGTSFASVSVVNTALVSLSAVQWPMIADQTGLKAEVAETAGAILIAWYSLLYFIRNVCECNAIVLVSVTVSHSLSLCHVILSSCSPPTIASLG